MNARSGILTGSGLPRYAYYDGPRVCLGPPCVPERPRGKKFVDTLARRWGIGNWTLFRGGGRFTRPEALPRMSR